MCAHYSKLLRHPTGNLATFRPNLHVQLPFGGHSSSGIIAQLRDSGGDDDDVQIGATMTDARSAEVRPFEPSAAFLRAAARC